jgi:hypothetical protein
MTVVAGKWKPGVLYTLYTSPAGGYDALTTGTDRLASTSWRSSRATTTAP